MELVLESRAVKALGPMYWMELYSLVPKVLHGEGHKVT